MSKKLILLFITITTLTNISYASFPVDTNKTDTTQVVIQETTEQYHLRIEKQGFDVESCVCESCRNGLTMRNIKTVNSRSSSSLYKVAAVLLILTLTLNVFGVWNLDGVLPSLMTVLNVVQMTGP